MRRALALRCPNREPVRFAYWGSHERRRPTRHERRRHMRLGLGLAFGGGKKHVYAWAQLAGSHTDLDFTTDNYRYSGVTYTTIAAFLTASSATFTSSNGSYVDPDAGTCVAVGVNTPRRGSQGLLMEPAATNVCNNNVDWTTAGWGVFASGTATGSRVANSGVAPDGTSTANLVTVNRSVNTDQAQVNYTFTGTAAAWSGGVWLKANAAGDVGKLVDFNMYNGVGTSMTVTITLTANWVWYRNQNRTQAANASNQIQVGYNTFATSGNAQTGQVQFLAWGMQPELGAVATTTIINTSGASKTRTADVFTFAQAQTVPVSIYGEGRGYTPTSNAANQYLFGVDDGTNANRILLARQNAGGSLVAFITASGAGLGAMVGAAIPADTNFKSMIAVDTSDQSLVVNGAAPVTLASASVPAAMNRVVIGARFDGGQIWSGWVRRGAIWSSRVANATEQTLTT